MVQRDATESIHQRYTQSFMGTQWRGLQVNSAVRKQAVKKMRMLNLVSRKIFSFNKEMMNFSIALSSLPIKHIWNKQANKIKSNYFQKTNFFFYNSFFFNNHFNIGVIFIFTYFFETEERLVLCHVCTLVSCRIILIWERKN